MDLLDSILNGMEKPPPTKKPEIKDKKLQARIDKLAKEREEAEKKEREALKKFRIDYSIKIKDFVNTPSIEDPSTTKLELEPMTKTYRLIIREICEDHEDELVVHSFGIEEEDRHCVIWKKGYEPCEGEIRAMKVGVEYNPEKESQDSDRFADTPVCSKRKMDKLIGESSLSIESAIAPTPGKQYGCVPVSNKKDLRTIEQIIEDTRSKKQKTSAADPESESQDCNSIKPSNLSESIHHPQKNSD